MSKNLQKSGSETAILVADSSVCDFLANHRLEERFIQWMNGAFAVNMLAESIRDKADFTVGGNYITAGNIVPTTLNSRNLAPAVFTWICTRSKHVGMFSIVHELFCAFILTIYSKNGNHDCTKGRITNPFPIPVIKICKMDREVTLISQKSDLPKEVNLSEVWKRRIAMLEATLPDVH